MNKLDGYKKGDFVRVTFDGVIESVDYGLAVSVFGGDKISTGYTKQDVESDTFQVQKIAKPYVPTVGDRVTFGCGSTEWKLVAIEDGYGILWNGLKAANVSLDCLRPYEA